MELATTPKAYGCGNFSKGCECDACKAREARHAIEFSLPWPESTDTNWAESAIRSGDMMVCAFRFFHMGKTPEWFKSGRVKMLTAQGWL